MPSNISVQRFRKLTQDLKDEVHAAAVAELNALARELAELIASVAPRGATGELEHSVRVVPGSKDTVVRVVCGGAATVKDGYQYPRADEFGTIHMPAKPFFFPTYRLRKKAIIASMKRKVSASIKKRSAE